MTKFFHLSKKSPKKFQRLKRLMPAMKTDIKTLNIIVAILIAVVGVGYLVEVNSLATRGYQIKDLETQLADLKQDQSDLQLDALSLQSMGTVSGKISGLDMVAAGQADYLSQTPVAVAR